MFVFIYKLPSIALNSFTFVQNQPSWGHPKLKSAEDLLRGGIRIGGIKYIR
jgi:hypothetical protein